MPEEMTDVEDGKRRTKHANKSFFKAEKIRIEQKQSEKKHTQYFLHKLKSHCF